METRTKLRSSQSNWEKRAASRENESSISRTRNGKNSGQALTSLSKSSSVPANLKSGNFLFCTFSLLIGMCETLELIF